MIVNVNREFRKKLSDCKNLFQVASYCYSSKDVRVYLGRDHVIFRNGKDYLRLIRLKHMESMLLLMYPLIQTVCVLNERIEVEK